MRRRSHLYRHAPRPLSCGERLAECDSEAARNHRAFMTKAFIVVVRMPPPCPPPEGLHNLIPSFEDDLKNLGEERILVGASVCALPTRG
jgi:hypothetical protein